MPPPSSSGYVIDGYIANATVFRDLNANGLLDPGEPFTQTDSKGFFVELEGSGGTIVAFGGRDISTDKAFTGQLTAPGNAEVVTPLTTLVQALIDSSKERGGELDTTTASAQVAAALGLDEDFDILTVDPVETNNLTAMKAGAQVAAIITAAAAAAATAAADGAEFTDEARDAAIAKASSAVASAIASAIQALPAASDDGGEDDGSAPAEPVQLLRQETISSALTAALGAETDVSDLVTALEAATTAMTEATTIEAVANVQTAIQGDLVKAITEGTEITQEFISAAISAAQLRPFLANVELPDPLNAAVAEDFAVELSGTGSPGSSIDLQFGSLIMPSVVTVGEDGTWSFKLEQVPADGSATLSVKASSENLTSPAALNTFTVTVDTTAPEIEITTPIAGDDILNAAEQGEDLVITGTAEGAEDRQVVTLTFNGQDYTAVVTGEAWSITIPAADLAGLESGAEVEITANVSDRAGNPAVEATASLATDFIATIDLDPVTIGTLSRFTGVEITGETVGVEAERVVTVTFDGVEYTGQVGEDGTWTVSVPASVIRALSDGSDSDAIEVEMIARVSDAAGNPASASATVTADFSAPALAITSPASGEFINADDASEPLEVSGQALPNRDVTVTLTGGATQTIESDVNGAWSASFGVNDLPDGPVEINATSDIEGVTISALTVTLTKDTVAPFILIGDGGDDGWPPIITPEMEFTSEDDDSILNAEQAA